MESRFPYLKSLINNGTLIGVGKEFGTTAQTAKIRVRIEAENLCDLLDIKYPEKMEVSYRPKRNIDKIKSLLLNLEKLDQFNKVEKNLSKLSISDIISILQALRRETSLLVKFQKEAESEGDLHSMKQYMKEESKMNKWYDRTIDERDRRFKKIFEDFDP